MTMLDYPADCGQPQHEYVCEAAKHKQDQVKMLAYALMGQLEGWCSHEKASIMMDIVFLLKAETVVEIGVFGGKSLVPMACACKANGKGVVYGIDPWDAGESAKGMEGVNLEWWGNLDHDKIYTDLKRKVKKFDLDSYINLLRCTSEEAPIFEEIDILHIDGNHSEDASLYDVMKWVPLVRKGGVIILDDIGWVDEETGSGTAKAVQYLNEHCIPFVEVEGDNQWGIWIKP
ncbi:MAG: class I SAM-dependent methyltransferase [Chlamydiales bacterium]|nr:class I SAM-dependent methyltransferase [Chlamydiia bacterium]MCP5508267.1 class I SAM-dependent methyltransferase [Chlamydiales bacterium]